MNPALHEVLNEMARRMKSFYTVCDINLIGTYIFYLKLFSIK
jgi:hypothetical protein